MLLPVNRIEDIEAFTFQLGKNLYYFRGGETPFNNSCSAKIAINKYCTNKVLAQASIPVPKLTGISKSEFEAGKLKERLQGCRFPLVIKPLDGGKGSDVLCNIKTITLLEKLLQELFLKYELLILEEFHANLRSFRVLVFNRQVIGVIERFPAFVIGDDAQTIEQLIQTTNQKRKKLNDALGKIVVDVECQIRLDELNLSLGSIPREGEQVLLGYTSNASRGGSFVSLSKQICAENRRLMIRAAQVLDLNLVGFDVECEDINLPIESTAGVIIEANDCPSVKIHEIPMAGLANPVTKKIIRSLIYRHPLSYLAVLYTNRKTYFYARSLIFVILMGLLYKLVVH
ncbi:MAG: UDP-N-acetylmuramyl peptide synthase [Tatlockia sp.]|nr:UDP-N-acetylmuramyl peptide synthase [Tatlockia sp.]